MKVKVDSEVCIGCGLCVNMAAEIFEMQDDKAVPKSEIIPEGQEENAKKMVEDCPVDAIGVE